MKIGLITGLLVFLITNIGGLYFYRNSTGFFINLMKIWFIFGTIATIVFVLIAVNGW